jgi:hypothetical protein
MTSLSIKSSNPKTRRASQYAATVLHALARQEAAGRAPARLTEPDRATWSRFKGRLGARHLLEILAEDAAVLRPVPFDPTSVHHPDGFAPVEEPAVRNWLGELDTLDLTESASAYLTDQARLLGIPSRLARSDLHKVQAHQKVLELSGTGGQLAFYIASTNDGVYLQDNVEIACESWEGMVLAGLAAAELNTPHTNFIRLDPEVEWARDEARRGAFDFVVGLHPDKGGRFELDRLRIWFPNATTLLV